MDAGGIVMSLGSDVRFLISLTVICVLILSFYLINVASFFGEESAGRPSAGESQLSH
jgi:hypothetical protein